MMVSDEGREVCREDDDVGGYEVVFVCMEGVVGGWLWGDGRMWGKE